MSNPVRLTFYAPSIGAINVGDEVPLPLDVFDVIADALVDPTTLSFFVLSPDGTSHTYVNGTDAEVERVSVGRFRLTVYATQAGKWRVVAIVDGNVRGREPTDFFAYATAADVEIPPT